MSPSLLASQDVSHVIDPVLWFFANSSLLCVMEAPASYIASRFAGDNRTSDSRVFFVHVSTDFFDDIP